MHELNLPWHMKVSSSTYCITMRDECKGNVKYLLEMVFVNAELRAH